MCADELVENFFQALVFATRVAFGRYQPKRPAMTLEETEVGLRSSDVSAQDHLLIRKRSNAAHPAEEARRRQPDPRSPPRSSESLALARSPRDRESGSRPATRPRPCPRD